MTTKADCEGNAANVLFKNSNHTLRTYTRTYSDASQLYTKSLLLQLKQNLAKENYYENKGTVKRDLSIETDICILRRYYKRKRTLINRGAASAKSKYSLNPTEIDTIDEFKHDASACGDSEQNVLENTHLNINLTSLIIDNLKDLLNGWIKTYLLEKKETKQRIDSVLDSIFHKLELHKFNDTSSSCTYTLDVNVVRNNSKKTSSKSSDIRMTLNHSTSKTSTLSIPLNSKCLKLISTLSLPRNINKINRRRNQMKSNIRKIHQKTMLLSPNKSNSYVSKSSTLKFLTIPTKSFTSRCVNYEYDKTIHNFPKPFSDPNDLLTKSSLPDNSVHNNQAGKLKHESIIKSDFNKNIHIINDGIHASCNHLDLHNNHQNFKQIYKNSVSTDEQDQSEPLITINLGDKSVENNRNESTPKTKPKKNKKCKKKLSKVQNRNTKTKHFTYLFKRSNNLINQEKTILRHFQSIFKYFSNWSGENDIKIDIKVNVFPINGRNINDLPIFESKKSNTNKQALVSQNLSNMKEKDNNMTTLNNENIISLLDGAVSKSKYIISRETSRDLNKSHDNVNLDETSLNKKHSNIAQELLEIKTIIKSLASATEQLAVNHLQKKNELFFLDSADKVITNKSAINQLSKSVQFSTVKSEITSGIKLRKGPKSNATKNYNPNLIMKNTSYKIIESESIIKVTDMTSAGQDFVKEKTKDEGLTCSLPKSKSLFEVSMGPDKKKLLAFYCDDFLETQRHTPMYNRCGSIPYCSNPCRIEYEHLKPCCICSKCNQQKCCVYETCPIEPKLECTDTPTNNDCVNDSSSICIDIDNRSCDNKITIRNRKGVPFWEGCLYCTLLWIPLLLISWLFYIHVIKDLINPKYDLLRKLSTSNGYKTDMSLVPITLTELGF